MEKTRKGNILSMLILGVLGILLIAFRETIKDVFYIVMGIGLILAAIAGVIGWWKDEPRRRKELVSLLGSLVLAVLGIWIITHPTTFDSIINWVIGIVLIVTGIQWIVRGFRLGRNIFLIIIGVIPVIMGLIVICANAATGWPIIVEGIGLIYAAISGIVTEWKFKE